MARVGTVAATYLLTFGLSDGQVNELIAAGGAFMLVVVDLIVARFYRKLTVQGAE